MGPKVTARVVRRTTDGLDIELTETNGVKATFTSYTATVETRNRNAQMITLFAWKVPESHTRKTRGGIQNGIVVKSGSKRFTIPAMNPETGGFKAAILRADSRLSLTLEGYDEIGRPVSISVAGLRQHFRCSCRDVPLIKTPFLIDE